MEEVNRENTENRTVNDMIDMLARTDSYALTDKKARTELTDSIIFRMATEPESCGAALKHIQEISLYNIVNNSIEPDKLDLTAQTLDQLQMIQICGTRFMKENANMSIWENTVDEKKKPAAEMFKPSKTWMNMKKGGVIDTKSVQKYIEEFRSAIPTGDFWRHPDTSALPEKTREGVLRKYAQIQIDTFDRFDAEARQEITDKVDSLGNTPALDIDKKELSVLSGTGTDEFNRLHKAVADYRQMGREPRTEDKDVTASTRELFEASRDYLFKKDPNPFHDYGKDRVAAAAKVMAQSALTLLAKPDREVPAAEKEAMKKDIELEMMRNESFRKAMFDGCKGRAETDPTAFELCFFAAQVNDAAAKGNLPKIGKMSAANVKDSKVYQAAMAPVTVASNNIQTKVMARMYMPGSKEFGGNSISREAIKEQLKGVKEVFEKSQQKLDSKKPQKVQQKKIENPQKGGIGM